MQAIQALLELPVSLTSLILDSIRKSVCIITTRTITGATTVQFQQAQAQAHGVKLCNGVYIVGMATYQQQQHIIGATELPIQ